MAAYISVPRDFTKVKSKVAFNLTARQLICFGAAAVVGVPLFFVLRDTGWQHWRPLGMMAVMLPMFFLAMYQKNGQPAEKILSVLLSGAICSARRMRPYKTNNYYAILDEGRMTPMIPFLKRDKDGKRAAQAHCAPTAQESIPHIPADV